LDLYFYTLPVRLDPLTGLVELSESIDISEIDVLKVDFFIGHAIG